MKTLLSVIIVAATLACVSCPKQGFDLADRMSMRVDNPLSTGTAWPLTEDSFLTVWHAVDGWPPVSITVNGLQVESFTRIPDQDAVILHMAEPHGYTPWPWEARELLPGERVYLSGWGVGVHWWSEGFATNDRDRLSLNSAPGDSGGPVMGADGDVVGIVWGRGTAGNHHCYFIPLTDLDLDTHL